MGKIISVAFSFEYGNCTYQEETEDGRQKYSLNPDHNFSDSPVNLEIQALCELLWTDERKSGWAERQRYNKMTPEERKEAGYN